MRPTAGELLDRQREELASWLGEYHQAMLDGGASQTLTGEAGTPDQRAAIASAKRCLDRLEDFRQLLSIPESDDSSSCTRGGEHAPLDSPRHFGRFQILRELGAGSQGIVYHARDPVLNREVALKVPRPETLVSPDLRARFLRESHVMARLSHPHLVPVYEVGQVGPAFYIASQYCSGPTLSAWQKSLGEPVAVRLAAEIIAVLADTVEYVHAQGVLHRDIKPGNVLLEDLPHARSRDAGSRRVLPFLPKLTDFGLAKLTDGAAKGTRSGAIAGTPAYMPPEQAEGRLDAIDERADVYALGAMLYELLTGQPPFPGRSALEVLRNISETTPVSPRRQRRDVPRDLAAICLKCLEYDPRWRYISAAALAADLRRFLSGECVVARPVSIVGAAWRRCRRKPVLALLLLALSVSLVSGFAAVTWQWRKAEHNRQRATANYQHARRVVAEFFQKLSNNDMFNDPAVQPVRLALLGIAERHYHEFVREHGQDLELEASLAEASYRTAFITATIGSRCDALVLYRESLPRWERLVNYHPHWGEPRYFLAKTHANIGMLLEQSREWAEATESHRRAWEIRKDLVRRHPANIGFQHDLAHSCQQMGSIHHRNGQDSAARVAYDRARELLERLVRQSPDQPAIRRSLGDLHRHLGNQRRYERKYEESLDHLKQAQTIFAALVHEGLENPWSSIALAEAHYGLAQTYRFSERRDEAWKLYEQARQLREQLVAAYPDVTSISADLASSYMRMGNLCVRERRLEEAIEYYERALGICQPLAEKHRSTLLFQVDLADVYFKLGEACRRQKAQERAQKAFREAHRLTSWLFREKAQTQLANRLANLEKRLLTMARMDPNAADEFGYSNIQQ